MENALNNQIKEEFFSAYLYKSMAAYFESTNLKGFAHWMELQAAEELAHGQKFYTYINSRFGEITLLPIEAPKSKWKSPLDAFEDAFDHEKKITKFIYSLVKQARSDNDYATETFLQWFVTEQVEEEDSADEIVQKLKMAGNNNHAILLLDRELMQRQ